MEPFSKVRSRSYTNYWSVNRGYYMPGADLNPSKVTSLYKQQARANERELFGHRRSRPMSQKMARRYLPKDYDTTLVEPETDSDDPLTDQSGPATDDEAEAPGVFMAFESDNSDPAQPEAASSSRKGSVVSEGQSGEPFQQYQNTKAYKKAVKKASWMSRKVKALKAPPQPPSSPPRTRSRDKKPNGGKSTGKGAKRPRERSQSQAKGGKSLPPPAKAQKSDTARSAAPKGGKQPAPGKGKGGPVKGKGSGQGWDKSAKGKSHKMTLAEAADKARKDPAMQHRSPLEPPKQAPIQDQSDWNTSGSVRAYYLAKKAICPTDLSRPGHVPGMIGTNLISVRSVLKNPELSKSSIGDGSPDGTSASKPDKPSSTVTAEPRQPSHSRWLGRPTPPTHMLVEAEDRLVTLHPPQAVNLFVRETLWPGFIHWTQAGAPRSPSIIKMGFPDPTLAGHIQTKWWAENWDVLRVQSLDDHDTWEEIAADEIGGMLDQWESVIYDRSRPLEDHDLDFYAGLVTHFKDINSRVERRRKDMVNIEGFAQNVLARTESLLKAFHERLSTQMVSNKQSAVSMTDHSAKIEAIMEGQRLEIAALRGELKDCKVRENAHQAVAEAYHGTKEDLEKTRQRNVRLDSELEDLREENDRLRQENVLLSQRRTWAERAECQAQAEATQRRPPPPPPPPPQAPEPVGPVAGPSHPQPQAVGLQDNVSTFAQMLETAMERNQAKTDAKLAAMSEAKADSDARYASLVERFLASSGQSTVQLQPRSTIELPTDPLIPGPGTDGFSMEPEDLVIGQVIHPTGYSPHASI